MKICVIYPDACSKSAKELAEALGCKAINPFDTQFSPVKWDVVFNYGCGDGLFNGKNVINRGSSVINCIDKLATFEALYKTCPVPAFTTNPHIAARWEIVVCRETLEGRANEGLTYWYNTWDVEQAKPKGKLFTKHFEHTCEYRIVVFKDKVVGRYRKDELEAGSWNLTLMQKKGFEDVDRSCLQAARALQIDYVGFDVLEAKDGSYVVLEANSGPILTEESKKAIVKYFKALS